MAFLVTLGVTSGLSVAGITIWNPTNGSTILAGQNDQANGDITGHVLAAPKVRENWANYRINGGGYRSRSTDYTNYPSVTTSGWIGNAWQLQYSGGHWQLGVYLIDFPAENAGAGGSVQ